MVQGWGFGVWESKFKGLSSEVQNLGHYLGTLLLGPLCTYLVSDGLSKYGIMLITVPYMGVMSSPCLYMCVYIYTHL